MSKFKSESEFCNGNEPSEGQGPSIEVDGLTNRGQETTTKGDELLEGHRLTMNPLLDLHGYTGVTLFIIRGIQPTRGIETLEYSPTERNLITTRGTPTL